MVDSIIYVRIPNKIIIDFNIFPVIHMNDCVLTCDWIWNYLQKTSWALKLIASALLEYMKCLEFGNGLDLNLRDIKSHMLNLVTYLSQFQYNLLWKMDFNG